MAKQLVLAANRVIAYGEDCFVTFGNSVFCKDSGTSYANATVVTCEAFPDDINEVGYEYHAGEFKPCAPYGKGTGTIPVLCDSCKTIKDSDIPLSQMGQVQKTGYTGTGTYGSSNENALTFKFPPKLVFIVPRTLNSSYCAGVIGSNGGFSITLTGTTDTVCSPIHGSISGNTLYWYDTRSSKEQLNIDDVYYDVYAIG